MLNVNTIAEITYFVFGLDKSLIKASNGKVNLLLKGHLNILPLYSCGFCYFAQYEMARSKNR
ncbi:hypothetical protein NEIMUCOT_03621 [Neisseria mucosa ATCC 25996]|uniref:Uncharacterized protein n=1 Tax=Neisseria mucosa (strain ATCC 25996 / DSM 4631 / NCTC 10774 / M26) TaxID=546266 RepID=D2ZSN9_NEIM2|nr:hypothetical protein NEIMUCOT_03621 [Neisseria mucosa ATCC 25996]